MALLTAPHSTRSWASSAGARAVSTNKMAGSVYGIPGRRGGVREGLRGNGAEVGRGEEAEADRQAGRERRPEEGGRGARQLLPGAREDVLVDLVRRQAGSDRRRLLLR